MRVISWNLLRLEGAAVADVAELLERERPDVLLMQEVTQHMDVLPHKVPGHYHRLPWPGRIHNFPTTTAGLCSQACSPTCGPGSPSS